MDDPLRLRCGPVAWGVAIGLASLLFSCSSDDDAGGAGASAAGTGKHDGGSAGSDSGSAGSNAAQSGSSGGAQDAGGPQHFPISGSGGNQAPADSGLPMSFEGSCTSSADCELCTGPLGVGDPCCFGCPLVSSQEICAQIRAAMSMCQSAKIGLCPQVSCVAPGSPECSPEGKCVMGSGIER